MTNTNALTRSRVWSVLTTPAAIPQTGPRLKTNLDTDLLKLIAIAAMLIDHIGGAFFPEVGVFRWIGRLAFPIFCYCLTVGLLYTHDVRKYLTRLGIFALVSQPFYILAFHPVGEFWANLTNWNIFFTLFLSLLGMYGLKERKWWLFALALFTVSWWNFDYSGTGIQLMLIFYLCRNRPGNERPQDVIVEPLALDHPFQPAHRASAALHQDDLSAGKLHAVGEGGLQPL